MSVASGVAAERWQPTAASLPMMARQVAQKTRLLWNSV
jgi:hypothetical protein